LAGYCAMASLGNSKLKLESFIDIFSYENRSARTDLWRVRN
jgi:hypothetical protein